MESTCRRRSVPSVDERFPQLWKLVQVLDDLLREGAAGGGIGTEWVGRKAWLRFEKAERSGSAGDDFTGGAVP